MVGLQAGLTDPGPADLEEHPMAGRAIRTETDIPVLTNTRTRVVAIHDMNRTIPRLDTRVAVSGNPAVRIHGVETARSAFTGGRVQRTERREHHIRDRIRGQVFPTQPCRQVRLSDRGGEVREVRARNRDTST